MRRTTAGCTLRRSDGDAEIRVDERGLLIGRGLGNDVVVASRAASTVHALVRLGPHGPEVVPLGKNPTEVNDAPIERAHPLRDGDVIAVPGERFVVAVGEASVAATPQTGWLVEDARGQRWGLPRGETRVGGGEDSGLRVPGWPEGAILLTLAQGGLIAQLRAGARINGARATGALAPLADGDVVDMGPNTVAIRLVAFDVAGGPTTEIAPNESLPIGVRFEFLPQAGRVRLTYERGAIEVHLAEVRAALMAVLLGQGGGYAPGDWCADDLVVRRVWPGRKGKGRVDVNNLVHRLRATLMKSGVNPFVLLERVEGATRIRLAPGARVEVV